MLKWCHGTATMNPLLYKMLCCVFMATHVKWISFISHYVSSTMACLIYHIFFCDYFISSKIFWKKNKYSTWECLLWFHLLLASEISFIMKRIQWAIIVNILRSVNKMTHTTCLTISKPQFSQHIWIKVPKMKFYRNHQIGAKLLHPRKDGWRERHYEANGCF
jgi:hypothetical protein